MAYREELKCLVPRQELWDSYCPERKAAEAIVPFLSPLHTELQSWQTGAISETLSTWLIWFGFALSWGIPEALPHPTYSQPKVLIMAFSYEWLD